MDYLNDIPLDIARAAHRGTSFVPEDRGQQERQGYANQLAADLEALSKLAGTEDKQLTLAAEFERYREGYRQRYVAMLAAKSRCVSTMIAGPSNFNVHGARKSSDRADARTRELLEYRTRALAAIRKTLQPELRPIMASDSDATTRLEAKIAKLEEVRDLMKRANLAIRKNAKAGPDAQVAALGASGFTEARARELLKPDFAGRIGFADYDLTNTGAEIRRLRQRLEAVKRNQATPDTSAEGEHAKLEDAPTENRVRLFFPGKPAAEIRERLKSRGFRWAPTLGCWQAYRNHASLETAREIAGAAS